MSDALRALVTSKFHYTDDESYCEWLYSLSIDIAERSENSAPVHTGSTAAVTV
jgi:hypothetical protein